MDVRIVMFWEWVWMIGLRGFASIVLGGKGQLVGWHMLRKLFKVSMLFHTWRVGGYKWTHVQLVFVPPFPYTENPHLNFFGKGGYIITPNDKKPIHLLFVETILWHFNEPSSHVVVPITTAFDDSVVAIIGGGMFALIYALNLGKGGAWSTQFNLVRASLIHALKHYLRSWLALGLEKW